MSRKVLKITRDMAYFDNTENRVGIRHNLNEEYIVCVYLHSMIEQPYNNSCAVFTLSCYGPINGFYCNYKIDPIDQNLGDKSGIATFMFAGGELYIYDINPVISNATTGFISSDLGYLWYL